MSIPLPDDFREALRMEGKPTLMEGLAHAEERLKLVAGQLEKLPENDPAQAALKREREMLEGIAQDLRDTVHGVKVDELCDAAEEALAEKPTRRAKAREFLKQARREGKPLPSGSVYLRRVQQLETKLEEFPGTAAPQSGTELDADATIPLQKPAANLAGDASPGTSGTTGKKTAGGTPVSPVRDPDETETGHPASTIPIGLGLGRKVGGGRFTLMRELGRGGMGVVWLASDGLLKREVAVKLLPPEVASDELALNDLRRETVESQRLSHPHIMRIHDLYQTPGEPAFISMEYVDGPNLRNLLGKQPQRCFSWDVLRPFMLQLASALDYAHSERVIHRDLKPSNLMLDSKNRLKLADFGIAATMSDSMSRVSRHDKDKDTSGTLNYMSPQQMRGDSPSAADDIYSLGATLYELLTSRTPFYRGDIQYQVKNEIPQTPAERVADLGITNEIPERVSAMVMACLAKDPKARPESATWMAEQMEGTARSARNAPVMVNTPLTAPGAPAGEATAGAPPPPPTSRERPTTGSTPPPDAGSTKTSIAPASVPAASPGDIYAASGKKPRGVLVGIIAILVFGLIMFLVWHHKSADYGTSTGPTPTTTSTGPVPIVVTTSSIQLTVQPEGSEVFSNDVSLGKPDGPLRLKGQPGESFKLEVRLDGYTSETRTMAFPAAGASSDTPITLQPLPALLIVTSDPSPTEIVLTRENGRPESHVYNLNGIQIDAGIAYEVVVKIPDRETVTRKVGPLTGGQRYPLDLPRLTEPAGTLRVMVDPPGTHFIITYPGHPAVPWGTNTLITGITPRVKFQLAAEHHGYISASRDLIVKPGETLDVDFGRLVMQTADLVVNATPRPFQLTVMWDGVERAYGTSGKASSLPAGRKLVISVTGDSGAGATTNMTLEPGDNTINFGSLTAPLGFLLIKSSPDGAEVSYGVDGRSMTRPSVMDRIDNLPLGHEIKVTLRKSGYEEKTLFKRLEHSGETLDFTRLVPLRTAVEPEPARTMRRTGTGTASIKVYGPNEDADIYVDGRLTGVKNDGVVSNLVAGHTYEIKLHRLGFEDLTANVTMNADSSEKFEMFPEGRPTFKVSEADLNAKLAEIDAKMNEVKTRIPFGEIYRRQINDWIDRTEKLYRRNPAVMERIKQPLRDLKELTNARSSRARRE